MGCNDGEQFEGHAVQTFYSCPTVISNVSDLSPSRSAAWNG